MLSYVFPLGSTLPLHCAVTCSSASDTDTPSSPATIWLTCACKPCDFCRPRLDCLSSYHGLCLLACLSLESCFARTLCWILFWLTFCVSLSALLIVVEVLLACCLANTVWLLFLFFFWYPDFCVAQLFSLTLQASCLACKWVWNLTTTSQKLTFHTHCPPTVPPFIHSFIYSKSNVQGLHFLFFLSI